MQATVIEFVVPGVPVPQPRPRVRVAGGHAFAYTPGDHPVHTFREAVAIAAKIAGATPVGTEVDIEIEGLFVFARPASHFLKSGELSASATRRPRPDTDNIGKAVKDALNKVAYADDNQVVDERWRRRYGARGEAAHSIVTIRVLHE